MRLYRIGDGHEVLTAEQFLARQTVALLEPEVVRRWMAMADTAADAGIFLSFSGGWRDGPASVKEFFRRYTFWGPTRPTGFEGKTAKFYPGDPEHQGGWYTLNKGEIPLATPYNGWHTFGRPGSLQEFVKPVAIDGFGNLVWMRANCGRFGFRASDIAMEGHHLEPWEYPTSRSKYDSSVHKLTHQKLPGDEEDDMLELIQVPGDSLVLLRDGVNVFHIRNKPGINVVASMQHDMPELKGKPVSPYQRTTYAGLKLQTPIVYDAGDPTPENMRTHIGDFLP